MVVSGLVGLLKFPIQQLGVVDTEPSMLSAHPDDFVDHVEAVFRDLRPLELIDYYLGHCLILTRLEVQQARFGTPTIFMGFLLFNVLGHVLLCLIQSIVVFLNKGVGLVEVLGPRCIKVQRNIVVLLGAVVLI